jgi:hypothetical protein
MLAGLYEQLPDALQQSEVLHCFDDLFDRLDRASFDPMDVAQALGQLAERHWHTYSTFPDSYKHRIEQLIERNWNTAELSRDYVEAIAFIAGHLGLEKTLSLFELTLKRSELDNDVRDSLESAVAELGPSISEPYSGLKHI